MAAVFGLVHNVGGLLRNDNLLRVHLVLCQVLNIHRAEVAQSHVECDFGKVDALDFAAFEQLAAEVHTGCRSGHSALVFGENCLVALGVFFNHIALDVSRKWRLAKAVKCFFELVV